MARRAANVTGGPLATVDLGGGLGIPYFSGERALDLHRLPGAPAYFFAVVEREARLQGRAVHHRAGPFPGGARWRLSVPRAFRAAFSGQHLRHRRWRHEPSSPATSDKSSN